jgi:hypothetical protein
MFCRSLFVLLFFFFWSLCCLFFFDIRFLIAHLVSANSSCFFYHIIATFVAEVFTTSGIYPWSFVTQIFHNGQPSHGGDRKIFEVMTSTLPKGTIGSVASLSSPSVFSGVRVTRSLVLYVCVVDRCLSFCTFSFGHCVVCSYSIYRF